MLLKSIKLRHVCCIRATLNNKQLKHYVCTMMLSKENVLAPGGQASWSSRDPHKYDPLQSNQMHQMKLLLFFLEAYMRVRADAAATLFVSVIVCLLRYPMMMTMTTSTRTTTKMISKRALVLLIKLTE